MKEEVSHSEMYVFFQDHVLLCQYINNYASL